MQIQSALILAGTFFVFFWIAIFLVHEYNIYHGQSNPLKLRERLTNNKNQGVVIKKENSGSNIKFKHKEEESPVFSVNKHIRNIPTHNNDDAKHIIKEETATIEKDSELKPSTKYRYNAKKGLLICNGERVDSEVIYWKNVPNDIDYRSPISPHHLKNESHDRYLTFEYDQGGWNNVRMGMESLIVVAHATGRTLVIPPKQHLYLLGKAHKDKEDAKEHDEMGFDDFFDINLLKSHRGLQVLEMDEFLEKEGVTGGLKNILPPKNSTQIWGELLWRYLSKVSASVYIAYI